MPFIQGYWWLPVSGFFMALVFMVGCTFMCRNEKRNKFAQISTGENAYEILKRRYAKGEIDIEELEQKKRDLDRFNQV